MPAVLTSGDHAAVAAYRRAESLRRTEANRPDLLGRSHDRLSAGFLIQGAVWHNGAVAIRRNRRSDPVAIHPALQRATLLMTDEDNHHEHP